MKNEPAENQIIIYQTEDGQTKIEVGFSDETVWLSQLQMADLFQKSQKTISEHINNIYKEGELDRLETEKKSGNSGNSPQKTINYYNLDLSVSRGFR